MRSSQDYGTAFPKGLRLCNGLQGLDSEMAICFGKATGYR